VRRAALLLALAAAGCGGGDAGPEQAAPARDPFADIQREREARTEAPSAAPRWEALTTLRGEGDARRAIEVHDRALQWRARWLCRHGALRVDAAASSGAPARLVDGGCPGSGEATAVTNGRVDLAVRAAGPWELRLEQQVDTPLHEPPLPAMGNRVARGAFYSLERRTRGRAELHAMPDGRLALRLGGFVTAASDDLYVWVSRARRPGTSRAALDSRHVDLWPLKATAGDHNYLLPRSLRREDVRSVVIWCEPIRIAYGAAALR
jgi:hypothetical protein